MSMPSPSWAIPDKLVQKRPGAYKTSQLKYLKDGQVNQRNSSQIDQTGPLVNLSKERRDTGETFFFQEYVNRQEISRFQSTLTGGIKPTEVDELDSGEAENSPTGT